MGNYSPQSSSSSGANSNFHDVVESPDGSLVLIGDSSGSEIDNFWFIREYSPDIKLTEMVEYVVDAPFSFESIDTSSTGFVIGGYDSSGLSLSIYKTGFDLRIGE